MLTLAVEVLGGPPTVTNTDQLFTAAPTLPSGASGVIGVAFGDFNNDGYPDLFLVPNIYPQGGRLYTNNRDGTFTLSTTGAMATNVSGFGAAWADYTNGGDLSLIVGQATSDYLYLGDGTASFTQVFANVGANYGSQFYPAWADYDGDGFVDLFMANGFGANYGVSGQNTVFHNAGNGTFTPVTAGILVTDTPSFSNCAVWADYDNDGLPDLFVANGRNLKTNALQLSFLYHNLGHGNFEKVASGPLVATLAGLNSAAWADYDNDGNLDLFTCGEGTGSAPQKRTLWHNDGGGNFSEATSAGSIDSDADIDEGCAWEDYDNDGYIDLVVTSGGSAGVRNPSLYHNNGDGTFTRVTLGALVNTPGDGGGLAWADVNNDGFPDLFVGNFQQTTGQPNVLYINKGNSNNWLTFACVGTSSNRSAIGAKVHVHATIGGKAMWQLRVVGTGAGYASQNELRAHVGLGDATVADTVRVEWPSGIVQTMTNVSAKQFLTVTEPSSAIPSFKTQPSSQEVTAGANASFSADATGTSTVTYQWNFNGAPIPGATGKSYTVSNAQASDAGTYTATATDAAGSSSSAAVTLTVDAPGSSTARLTNISTRAQVGTGSNILIPGFVIGGTGTETLLVRGDGPALTQFGVTGVLAQPVLGIFDVAGKMLATNTGWGTASNPAQLASLAAAVPTFALSQGSADSAILVTLPAGAYTVQVSGLNSTTGVALAEVYEISHTGNSRLTNISTRAQVGTGANIIIPGFVVSGSGSEKLLIRADGPALAQFGVSGALAQPGLSVLSGSNVVASNIGWSTAANSAQIAVAAAAVPTFAFASGSADSAQIVDLAPGAYTAQVAGANGTTGVSLAEVYEIQ